MGWSDTDEIKMKKYIIPIAIVIGVLVIGLSLVTVQYLKQNSIERQQRMKIDQEKAELQAEEDAESIRRSLIADCETDALIAYWYYMELNGTTNEDGTITAQQRYWDIAEERKQQEIDNCFKKY